MNRLVVNPDRPDAWEIQLKDGANQLGRGDASDFKIADPSVSSSHCQIVVSNGAVSIQDLGSTNGTFINSAPVQEAKLQNGQTIRLGGIEMIFYADSLQPAASPATPRLRLSGMTHAPKEASPVAADPPPPLTPALDIRAASSVCKFHPKNFARWFCNKCSRSFCDLCVTSRNVGETVKKICRSCGVECAPLEVKITVPTEKGFLASLPGAFVYPFRGTGLLILIFGTLVFAGLGIVSAGIFSILMKMAAIGYLFSYMQNIIHATAAKEAQMPELPGMDDLFGGFFRLAGTVLISFGLPIGLLVAKFFGVDVPVSVIIMTGILGFVYFPMAFLAVAIKDNVMASNPLVVVHSILRVPFQYLVTVIVFVSIFGIQRIGDMVAGGARAVTFTTTDMSVLFMSFGIRIVWSFTSVYLLTVNMRIMGLLYSTQKEKLGW
jgi:pSer/pThr/pTyr-binding forkhead associated (FHA) protein